VSFSRRTEAGTVAKASELWYAAAKEHAMIELTEQQRQALDAQAEKPPVVIDPQTGQEYLLIRREVSELVRATLKPYGRGWDDPGDDDLIRKDL
jgi:hypothetical protein